MKPTDQPPETPPGQEREISIIVNGRERVVPQKELSFDEIVALAFGPANYDTSAFTVNYRRGPDHKQEGSLQPGDVVKLKSGMIFNVVRTDKS